MKTPSSTFSRLVSKTLLTPLVVLTVSLAGCGGGGGGGGGSTGGTSGGATPTPTPTVAPTETATPTVTVTPTPTPTPTPQMALSGSVSSFPAPTSSSSKTQLKSYGKTRFQSNQAPGDAGADGSIGTDDLEPAGALVSLFLLKDVDFVTPIATVKTDPTTGAYEVTSEDVRPYLLAQNLITSEASETEVLTAFRALGRLQVRAVLVKVRENGDKEAIAIQSIADPDNLDDAGEPVPVPVDPIVHRVVKAIVDQIRDSIQSLADMGLSQTVVDQLTETVVSEVASEITRVVSEAATSTIEIPEGQSFDDVVAQQESTSTVTVSEDDITALETVIADTSSDDGEAVSTLANTLKDAEEVEDTEGALGASLDSDEQGLLSSLESTLSDSLNSEVDDAIEDADGDETALAALFVAQEGQSTTDLLAAQQAEKNRQLRKSFRRLFMSMGLAVVVEENAAGDAAVVAINMPSPPHVPAANLPGGKGFDDRSVRIFKVGEGTLDADSQYTTDANLVGTVNTDVDPNVTILYHAPALSDVVSGLLTDIGGEDPQLSVDEAFNRIASGASPTTADFALIDRVRLYNDFSRRMQETSLVSSSVLDKLVDNKSATIKIKRLAAVLAQYFKWAREGVNVSPEGLPIFTDRDNLLEGGADAINSSELVRALSITLPATAGEATSFLTGRVSFYAQFASEAVQGRLQQAIFEANQNQQAIDFAAELAEIYPSDAAGYRDLILGTATNSAAPDYQRARDRVSRGLSSSVPATLFGRTLTSESEINIRSALFFLNFLMRSEFVIDPAKGFFKEFVIDVEGTDNDVLIPNFNNVKFMQPGDNVTVATLVSELLSITQINNGDFHGTAQNALFSGLGSVPTIPEFKEQDLSQFEDDLGGRATDVNMSCTVERFDGTDPDAGNNPLQLSVFAVNYNPNTGAFQKGDELSLTQDSVLETGEGPVRRTYTISGLSPGNETDGFGRDYVVRFSIANYQNDLPELFFWVDGFSPEINLCDPEFPLFIGADQQFVSVPGLGLVSDQSRPDGQGGSLVEGIDVSNFEQPGAPIYLTSEEEAAGQGTVDFTFEASSTAGTYTIVGANGVGFAPLYGGYEAGELLVSLTQGTDDQLQGIHSLIGQNIRSVLEEVGDELPGTVDIVNTDPFEHDLLYLMQDAAGKFWVIEVRFLDVFTGPDGNDQGFIDIGIASVGSLGNVKVPEAAFNDFPGGDESSGGPGIFWQNMLYGDWLILEPPTGYEGPGLLEAQEVSIGTANSALYSQLEGASDGIVIRYASGHFEDNITSVDSFDAVFGNPPDYSTIPVRIQAGRTGITFVKLRFNKSNLTWVMEPAPENKTVSASNLKHNDIVAVFDNQAADAESPVYLGRVLREKPADDPYANFEIAFEWINFAEAVASIPDGEEDPREVVCFADENGEGCSSSHPELFFSSALDAAVGSVFDEDYDGVPALFDPNDSDPNVPGSGAVAGGSGGFVEGITVSSLAESDGEGNAIQSFLTETVNMYPGEIQRVSITSDIFGIDSLAQSIFTCTPPSQNNSGVFTDFSCTARTVEGGVTVSSQYQNGGGVGFKLAGASVTPGTRVDFNYQIVFRAPTGLDGTPFMCGSEACPARPSVLVPQLAAGAVFDGLTVTSASGEPQDLGSLSSLNVSNGFTITGDPISGAFEYELSIFCAGSQPDEPYLPEENIQFFAPARDGNGQAVRPEFHVNAPWIGGRSCKFTLNARMESNSGEYVGVSTIAVPVTTTGGGTSFDNELSLAPTQTVCLLDGLPQVADSGVCETSSVLFSFDSYDSESATATITLDANNVEEARADGGRRQLTQGHLEEGAVVSFNVDLDVPEDDIVPPTCGAITTDQFSNTCAANETVSTNFFSIESGLMLVHTDVSLPMQFQTDVGLVSSIALDQPGFYRLVLEETDPDSGDTFLQEIMEIQLDSFPDASGETQIFVNFTLTAGVNEFHSGDSETTFELTAPGFMEVDHVSGQPVDFDIRFAGPDVLRLNWYLPPPQADLAGDHDINGDSNSDLSASYATGTWTFTFTGGENGVSSLELFDPSEGSLNTVDAETDGSYLVNVNESDGFAEFFGRIGDQNFRLFSGFEGPGEGFLEMETFFGGGTGGPGECFDCPSPLAETFIADGVTTLSLESATGDYHFDGAGDPLVDVTVSSTGINVALAIDATGTLSAPGPDGQPVQGSSLDFPKNGGFFFLRYDDGAGNIVDIEIQDFGVDVAIRVWEGFDNGGPGGEPGDMGNPDIDGDGIPNEADNCVVVSNPGQENTGGSELGDACEMDVEDMSGVYQVTITQNVDSQDFDEASGVCVDAENESLLVSIEMEGNQIFFEIIGEDDAELVGVMGDAGAFSLFDPDAGTFSTTSGQYTSGTFSFSFTDLEENDAGGADCQVSANVSGDSPTPVSEESVFISGVSWFESDNYDGQVEFEYGSIQSGSLEQFFFYESGWVEETETETGSYLTDTGIVVVDDRFIVAGMANGADTAIIEPTQGGMAMDDPVQQEHIDLAAFDIEGMDMVTLLGEDYEAVLPEDAAPFPAGSSAYVATITTQLNAYFFWCDDDNAPAELECQNALMSFQSAGPGVAITSLDDAVNSNSELSGGMLAGGLYAGNGFDINGGFVIDGYFASSDGTATVSDGSLRVVFVKHYFSSGEAVQLQYDAVVTQSTLNGTAVLEYTVPDEVARMGDLDEDQLTRFIFVDTSDTTFGAVVRQGEKEVAGTEFKELLFNETARAAIVTATTPVF